MVGIKLTVTLQSPLSLGETPLDGDERARQHIPGAMLRGAVGTALARQCGHGSDSDHTPDCVFGRVFLIGAPPRFGPLYPTPPAAPQASHPLPHTARTCKYYPGFRSDSKDGDHHGVHDALFASWKMEQEPECAVCAQDDQRGALKRARGFFVETNPGQYIQPRLWTQRLARTAIDRRRGTAADQRLYTLEVVTVV